MVSGSLARRYAKALIALGAEENKVERIADDLHVFGEVLALGDGELRKALENPGVTVSVRRAVLEEVFKKLDLHPHVANFIRLLVDKNRFLAFRAIARAYGEMADVRAGRVRATVTTATELSAEMAEEVKAALTASTGKTVVVSFDTDASLIGGIVAEIGDTVIDASVRARLEQMRAALLSDPTASVGDA